MYIKDVVEVWGVCESSPITFERIGTSDEWQCEFPADMEEGTYVLEVFAKDIAGNVGHYASIIFTYDPTKMCVNIIKTIFYLQTKKTKYHTRIGFLNHYSAHVTRCELCGRF